MQVHSIKTDNASISSKVELRKRATEGLTHLRVLDLFAGENVLWSHFDCELYFGVDKEKGKGKNLWADNKRLIPSLDLSRFNVIDCDSYGMPVDQLDAIFKNRTLQSGTVIIYTCIGSAMSATSKILLEEFGLREMYKKCKVLINDLSAELFFAWLYNNGVRKVTEYSSEQNYKKHYGYFFINY